MIKPDSCNGCSLVNISNGFAVEEGEGTSGVVILGEGLGWNEYVDGKPFRPYGQGGSKLEECFKLVSRDIGQPVNRNQFLLYNTVNCHPPGDKLDKTSFEKDAVANCSKNVDRVVGGFKTPHQKTILALGNVPLKALTGVSGVSEEKQSVRELRGFVFQSKYGLVIPSYHPKMIRMGNGHLTPMLVEDIKRAMGVAKGVYTSYSLHKDYKKPNYQISPSVDEAKSFYYKVKDSPKLCLSYDIETNQTASIDEDEREDLSETDIKLVQFSISRTTGIALPWTEGYMETIKHLFQLSNVKANHNTWNFDNPRIRAKGIEINGKIHDTMWMFKHYHPKLPRGLQSVASLFGFPFPWKHLYSANLEWYGCADVDAVQWIIHILPKLMKERGVWEGYRRHVMDVYTVLDRASTIGIPVNDEKRLALEVDFKERRKILDGEIQKQIPDELRNIKPKRKDKDTGEIDYGYIREPKIVGEEYSNYQRLSERAKLSGRNVVTFEEYLYRKHNLTVAEFERMDKGTRQKYRFNRWCIVEDFKASKDQLVRYLKWKKGEIEEEIGRLREERQLLYNGRNPELTEKIKELQELADDYEVPFSLKTKKETTSKQELEEMFFNTGDTVLENVVKIRSYDTNLNNFVPNWKPFKDGRVHPVYMFIPPQGQINSRDPNSQNVSKHTEFGQEFRRIIEAPKGYCFVEADKKSFHVGLMGFEAKDKGYIRFSQIDPHSILGSHIDPSVIGGSISLKWSDGEIREAAEEFKKRCKAHAAKDPQHNINVRQQLAKPTVVGNQLELGAKKLQRQNRRFIATVKDAEKLQAIISDLFPKIGILKKNVKEKAHIDKYLINEFYRIQYFYDVFTHVFSKKMGKWVTKDGVGAREPIAFKVQSPAFGMITEELLELERLGVCEEYNFVVTIHDSLMFMPEIGKKDRLIEILADVMNRPCKQLVNEATDSEGLKIGIDISVGSNWKEKKEI